jgi:excisionase family DNA binding protein
MAALGIKAAAAELGVSTPTVRRLIKVGALGYGRVGRRVVIPAAEVARFQAERFQPATHIDDAAETHAAISGQARKYLEGR